MRSKVMVWTLAATLTLGSAGRLLAAGDDVFIDYSALDELDGVEASAPSLQPLFPVVSKASSSKASKTKRKTPKKQPVRAKKAPKSESKVSIPAKVKVEIRQPKIEAPKSSEDLFETAPAEVKDETAAAPVVPVKTQIEVLPQPEVVSDNVETSAPIPPNAQPIPYVESDAPVEVVEVEPAPETQQEAIQANPKVVEQPIVETALETTETSVSSKIDDSEAASTAPEQEETPVVTDSGANQISASDAADNKTTAVPLVPAAAYGEDYIVFPDDESDLTPEQQSHIDAIIGRFDNAGGNKIAIYAYNLDDGVDAFRKKRVSLNRAVEVRSYLLKQGFKNFSIKVINVESGAPEVNRVQIGELK